MKNTSTKWIFTPFWKKGAPFVDGRLQSLKEPLFRKSIGAVLELGPGTGVNFSYFPPGISWIGIEPNRALRDILMTHPKRPAHMRFVENLEEVPTESIDTVVSSLVLCSVPDLTQTVRNIRRILKVGGQLFCVEHVGAPHGTFLRLFQRLIRPVTKTIGGGCEPDRDIGEVIQKAGWGEIKIVKENIRINQLPFSAPLIVCRAQKEKQIKRNA